MFFTGCQNIRIPISKLGTLTQHFLDQSLKSINGQVRVHATHVNSIVIDGKLYFSVEKALKFLLGFCKEIDLMFA